MLVDTLLGFLTVTLFSIIVLFIVGYSSLRLIGIVSRKDLMNSAQKIFGLNSDGTFKFIFYVYLGVVFCLLLAEILILLDLVNYFVISFFIAAMAIVVFYDIFKKGRNIFKNIKLPPIFSALGFLLILVLLGVECWRIIGGQAGPISDALYHTDVINVLTKNQYFEANPGIILGAHSLTALLTVFFQISITKSVLVFSSIFSVMIPLGFYSLAVACLRSRVFGLVCAFVGSFFWLDSMNPISWGSIYLPLAFFVILCALGFSKKLLFAKQESVFYVFLFSFLLFIPLWTIYPVPVLVFAFWLVLLLSYRFVSDCFVGIRLAFKNFIKRVSVVLIASSLAISSCFLFIRNLLTPTASGDFAATFSRTIYADFSVSEFNNNVAAPFSVFTSFSKYTDKLWGFFTERPGSFDIIPYGVIAAIGILLLIVARKELSKRKNEFLVIASKITLLFYAMSFIFFLYFSYLDSYLFNWFPSVRVMEFQGIIFVMLAGLSIVLFWGIIRSKFLTNGILRLKFERFKFDRKRIFWKPKSIRNSRGKIATLAALILALALFSYLVNAQAPLDSNTNVVIHNAAANQMVTEDDIMLQQWINVNLSRNSTILFSPVDGGFNLMYLTDGPQYVGVYGDWPTIIFSSGYVSGQAQRDYCVSYLRLICYLANYPDSPVTLNLLRFFNVTYIYIGAYQNLKIANSLAGRVGSLGVENFDFKGLRAQLLNDSFYYKFVKGVGDASLFKFEYPPLS